MTHGRLGRALVPEASDLASGVASPAPLGLRDPLLADVLQANRRPIETVVGARPASDGPSTSTSAGESCPPFEFPEKTR